MCYDANVFWMHKQRYDLVNVIGVSSCVEYKIRA